MKYGQGENECGRKKTERGRRVQKIDEKSDAERKRKKNGG